MEAAVHVVMGQQEAQVVTSALGHYVAWMSEAIQTAPDNSEQDRDNLMTMLSLQFSAEAMHESLASLLSEVQDDEEDEYDE